MRLSPPTLVGAFPASLIAILAAIQAAQAIQLLPHQAQEQAQTLVSLAAEKPTAIRKMGVDNGEKFFPHMDMSFASNSSSVSRRDDSDREDFLLRERADFARIDDIIRYTNASTDLILRPPFAPHSAHNMRSWSGNRRRKGGKVAEDEEDDDDEVRLPYDGSGIAAYIYARAHDVLAVLGKRDFSCPAGTESCVDIGYSNYCCGTDESCVIVDDTGLGPVGCCPFGDTCGGTVAGCPEPATACPADMGGGCCIEGYICQGVGCVLLDVVTITNTPTSTPPSSTSTTTPPSFSSSTSSTLTTPTPTPTPTAVPPTRPTDDSCPTGFYACSATYGGGCCQTGRDCQTTSCPPLTYTTIISNGVTIAVPLTALPDDFDATPSCAGGWYLCGDEAGPRPGCCPDSYLCGTASCTVSDEEKTATVAKELPNQTKLGGGAGAGGWNGAGEAVGTAVAVAVVVVGRLLG